MSRDQVRKLLGGYATGTLTPEECQALFEAALDDQPLFDALAREQSLRDLLRDPAATAQLLAALDETPATWRQRATGWMWGHAVGLAALACFVAVGAYVARQAHFAPPRVVLLAMQPNRVDVHGSQPPPAPTHLPVFDLRNVNKAPAPLPPVPAPPVLTQRTPSVQAAARSFAVGGIMAGGGGPLPVPRPPEAAPAPAAEPQLAGGVQLGAGTAGAIGGGARGGFGGMGTLQAGSAANLGTLTGTVVDSSNAAVPGAQIEARNLATGAVHNTVSGPEGIFVFNSLEPGRYNLTTKASGFKTSQTNDLSVTTGAPVDLGRVPLALGAFTEEISVAAAARPVQTASSQNSSPAIANQERGMVAVPAMVRPQPVIASPPGAGKLAPALVVLVQRVRSGAPPSAEESRFISGGWARVHVTLTNASADSLAQLRKTGFAIAHRNRTEVTGQIAVLNLETLAQLPFVVWVKPQ